LFRQQCRQGGKLEFAVELIRRELAFGERKAVEMFVLADKAGISERTLKSAKSLLGVYSEKRNEVWYWSLSVGSQIIYESDFTTVYDSEVAEKTKGASKGANALLHPCLHS
jgi:hypothetical protein